MSKTLCLFQILLDLKQYKQLPQSFLINTNDLNATFDEIDKFFKQQFNLKQSDYNSENIIIKPQEATKNINIDQIKEMHNLMHNTSKTGLKIAFIFFADCMNINSANSCLKILEEPPQNSYIFLLTSLSFKIIPTIRSRCYKLAAFYPEVQDADNPCYDELIKAILQSKNLQNNLNNINFTDFWNDFDQSFKDATIMLLTRAIKYSANAMDKTSLNHLRKEEVQLFQKAHLNIYSLLEGFENIKTIFQEHEKYDLEKRASATIILSEIMRNFK